MSKYDAKIFDGNSVDALIKSIGREFSGSSTLKRTFNDGAIAFNDAAVTAAGSYLEVQLTHVIPKVLKRVFPAKPALSIFSVSNEGRLAQTLVRRMKTYSGEHKRENENKSVPNRGHITVAYDATGLPIETYEATSEYKEIDLLRAAMLNDALDASLIEAHDESYKTSIDYAAFLGMTDEAGTQITEGLLNRSDVDSNLEANATAAFASATGYQMYSDIKDLIAQQRAACAGEQSLWADVVVTSPATLSLVDTTTYGLGGATPTVENYKTVGQMIRENLGIKNIWATNRAVNLDGTGTTDRLCLFNSNPDVMTLYIPMPLTFSEVLKQKFNYTFDTMFRVAGLGINQKVAFAYLKGC